MFDHKPGLAPPGLRIAVSGRWALCFVCDPHSHLFTIVLLFPSPFCLEIPSLPFRFQRLGRFGLQGWCSLCILFYLCILHILYYIYHIYNILYIICIYILYIYIIYIYIIYMYIYIHIIYILYIYITWDTPKISRAPLPFESISPFLGLRYPRWHTLSVAHHCWLKASTDVWGCRPLGTRCTQIEFSIPILDPSVCG